ncbi:DNA translocase FtsK [Edaphobacillus lindanitolerans]|uniref:DNA translocase FtsK n=1 Tax=Edaphobacillus lindanitolerans TaxID=550447 RepID=UPI0009772FAA|nr:DNA translocase FtsK [Edaphobacillus lindanitolerans]
MNWFKRLFLKNDDNPETIETVGYIEDENQEQPVTGRRSKFRFPLISDEEADVLEERQDNPAPPAQEEWSDSGQTGGISEYKPGPLGVTDTDRRRFRNGMPAGTFMARQQEADAWAPRQPIRKPAADRSDDHFGPAEPLKPRRLLDERPKPPTRTRGFQPTEVPSPVYGFGRRPEQKREKAPSPAAKAPETGLAERLREREETTINETDTIGTQTSQVRVREPRSLETQATRTATPHDRERTVNSPRPSDRATEPVRTIGTEPADEKGKTADNEAKPVQEPLRPTEEMPEAVHSTEQAETPAEPVGSVEAVKPVGTVAGPGAEVQQAPASEVIVPADSAEEKPETDRKGRSSGTPFNVVMLKSDRERLEKLDALKGIRRRPAATPGTGSAHNRTTSIPAPAGPERQMELPASEPAADVSGIRTSRVNEPKMKPSGSNIAESVASKPAPAVETAAAEPAQVHEPAASEPEHVAETATEPAYIRETTSSEPVLHPESATAEPVHVPEPAVSEPSSAVETAAPAPDSVRETTAVQAEGTEPATDGIEEPEEDLPYYMTPGLDFLNPPAEKGEDTEWMEQQAATLEEALSYFSVKAKVIGIVQGPAVTQFELTVGHGTKVSKIRNLQDDLKLALAARDIRIQAPIPGKSSIGIEIPNRISRPVRISELIGADVFRESDSPLEAVLGLDLSGRPTTVDLRKMPHGLIAGATGSGKSVCINSILTSLLYKASPDELRMLLIDPKMVELAPYNRIPHLVSPVITDVKAANAALKWAVEEMERRYELFVHAGVRDIVRFNRKAEEHREFGRKLPYLLIVIDELADLMMAAPAEVEESICRIAQKARACGIHLIIATQRPSVDVITGLIKANIPARIAFSVSSQVDSRTIIDVQGAERLLGRGDMLYLGNGMPAPVRLQGTFVTDDEIERVTDFVRRSGEPDYLFRQEELLRETEAHEAEDPLFGEACSFIIQAGSASTSMLQRKFSIGYNRAARLIDMLEERGYVSPQKGSKPRDVYLTDAGEAPERQDGPAHTI